MDPTIDADESDWIDRFWDRFVEGLTTSVAKSNTDADSPAKVHIARTENFTGMNVRTSDELFNQTIILDRSARQLSVQHPSRSGAWPENQAKLPDLLYQLRCDDGAVFALLDDKDWNAVKSDLLPARIVSSFLKFTRTPQCPPAGRRRSRGPREVVPRAQRDRGDAFSTRAQASRRINCGVT